MLHQISDRALENLMDRQATAHGIAKESDTTKATEQARTQTPMLSLPIYLILCVYTSSQ